MVAPNVHVGTIGGGAAIARTNPKLNQDSAAKSQAAAEAGNVTLNILSGYNVGTMAAGVALSFLTVGWAIRRLQTSWS